MSTPHSTAAAAAVRRHVAGGQAERREELWQAPGLCVHVDPSFPWTPDAQTESSAPSRSQSEGKADVDLYVLLNVNNTIITTKEYPPKMMLSLEYFSRISEVNIVVVVYNI